MSMNLYIELDGQKIDVYQTPTHITFMCLMTDIGVKPDTRGKEAKRAVLCYLEYVDGLTNRSFESIKEMEDYCYPILDHIREVRFRLESAKEVYAYML